MRIVLFLSIGLLITSALYSQDRPRIIVDIPSNQKPFTGTDLNRNNFQFAIVTDRTGGHRPGVFMEGIHKLNLLQPEFVMSVGDLIEGYTEDVEVLDAEWKEFNGFIDSLQMPFFYVPGNHDITNQVMEDKWMELFGVSYYHFVYQEVLFLCLNSEDNRRGAGRGTIDDAQYEYIKETLEANPDVKWTLVFLHQPLWVQEDTKRWKDVEALLSGRPHNVFAGHYHRYWKTGRNNGKYIALATTGGSSRLRGTAYGEFDHVVWVTMTDEGPLLANLLLEGIWDEDIVTEDVVDLVRNRPYPVAQEPIFLDRGTVESLSTELRITNDSDYQMHVKVKGWNHPSVHYTLSQTSFEVGPNNVEKVGLTIENPGGEDLIENEPITLHTEVSYQYPGRPDIVLPKEVRLAPVMRHRVAASKKRIKLDGDLREWRGSWYEFSGEHMEGSLFDYRGMEDVQVRFQAAYDDENLYIALDITDDEIYTNENGSLWDQDAILLGLDGRSWPISAMNNGEGRNSEWAAFLRTFREKDPVYRPEAIPVPITSQVQPTESGMAVELSIPLSYLNQQQDDKWSEFRLGVGYYDVDKEGEARTEHYWYPAWGSAKSLAGQGMFFRED